MNRKSLKPGDRVAYSARHLKTSGQATGSAALRRGTYVGEYAGAKNYCRVRWDDNVARIAARAGQFAHQDYCDDVANNGSLAHSDTIRSAISSGMSYN